MSYLPCLLSMEFWAQYGRRPGRRTRKNRNGKPAPWVHPLSEKIFYILAETQSPFKGLRGETVKFVGLYNPGGGKPEGLWRPFPPRRSERQKPFISRMRSTSAARPDQAAAAP